MNEVFTVLDFEGQVRDRAYALWESEGRPAGRDGEHWRMSEAATLADMAAAMKKADKPVAQRKKASSKRVKAA